MGDLRAADARRGHTVETPKSGNARVVALSRRLRRHLLALQLDRWEPSPEAEIIGPVNRSHFRKRSWRRILKRAGLEGLGVRPKDLRSTFASQLITAGVRATWIQKALGHGSLQVTMKHYAQDLEGEDDDVESARRAPGEVWPDLLARIPEPGGGAYVKNRVKFPEGVSEGSRKYAEILVELGGSNPRLALWRKD